MNESTSNPVPPQPMGTPNDNSTTPTSGPAITLPFVNTASATTNPVTPTSESDTTSPEPMTTSTPVENPGESLKPQVIPLQDVPSDTTVDYLAKLDSAEEKLISELESINSEQTGLIDKLKKLIEQTGFMESNEGKLNNQIKKIQEARTQIKTDPEKSEDIFKDLEFIKPHPVEVNSTDEQPTPTIDKSGSIPPATSNTPAISPIEEAPESPVTPLEKERESLTPEQIIEILNKKFSDTNPAVANTVVSGAQVYATPEMGLLIEHATGSVHFSPTEVTDADITTEDLHMLPQKTESPAVKSTLTTEPSSITDKLKTLEQPELNASLASDAKIYRSQDKNGIVIGIGIDAIHISDAELIQTGINATDLASLEMAPAFEAEPSIANTLADETATIQQPIPPTQDNPPTTPEILEPTLPQQPQAPTQGIPPSGPIPPTPTNSPEIIPSTPSGTPPATPPSF
ncbi:MAG: hypothetical protein Q8P90_03255 [bacterium]|nr:hypothetical protein [bacterium]